MSIVYVGIDLAKNGFAVHGVDEAGKPALMRPTVPRAKLRELIASLPPCTVAMERAAARTIGRGCLPPTATLCV
jgi:transposase